MRTVLGLRGKGLRRSVTSCEHGWLITYLNKPRLFDCANFNVPNTRTKISAQETRPTIPYNFFDKLSASWTEHLPNAW